MPNENEAGKADAEQQLAQCERHVTQGWLMIERQQTIVAELERGGHDATLARALLAEFHRALKMHIGDCDRVRVELARMRQRAQTDRSE